MEMTSILDRLRLTLIIYNKWYSIPKSFYLETKLKLEVNVYSH